MNVETEKARTQQTPKAPRRKRKTPPRRVPAVIEQREARPFIFGWGAHLSQRERESLKERIALFGGVALAALLLFVIGWGWYQDNIAGPAQAREANNRPVAQVGSAVITTGFFKRYEQFQNTQINNQLSQISSQLAQLQTNAKKNAAGIAQLQAQQSSLQQQQNSLASGALTSLIDSQAVLQRSYTAGVPNTKQAQNTAWNQIIKQAGGKLHLEQSISQSGLTESELRSLVTADYLKQKIATKLAAGVKHTQLEVRASHILIPTKKKALAKQVYKEALHGASFAALAKKYSTDPGSATKGGDVGYFPRGQMVAPFENAAFSMKVGQIRLIQSTYGWHIIKATGRKMSKLSSTQYQQAQQSAYTSWLAKQEALLHVQRFLSTSQLPNVVTPQPSSLTNQGISSNPSISNNSAPVQVNPSTNNNKASSKQSSKPAKP